VIPAKRTAESVLVAVRIDDRDGTELFSRVYDLRPGHGDESGGIEPESRPAQIVAFVDGGPPTRVGVRSAGNRGPSGSGYRAGDPRSTDRAGYSC
jgi:hypothetical protein